MTDWVRLWHDMPTDPKWRVVARKAGQPLPCVISLFSLMMVNASANSADRGRLLGWDHEDAAAALDIEPDAVRAIYDAMQGKVLDGDRLTGWERRQPKREDAGVGARVAKHRETKAATSERDETPRNDTKRDVTHVNAPEQSRADKSRAEAEKIKGKASPSVRSPTGSRLPDGWLPTSDMIAFASKEGFSPDEIARTADDFRDYWAAESGAKARKADWLATWRRWVRRDLNGVKGNGGKQQRQHGPTAGEAAHERFMSALAGSGRGPGLGGAMGAGAEREGGDDRGRETVVAFAQGRG